MNDSPEVSLDLFELLQRPQIGGVRLARVDLRPGSPRHLADIDVAVPIDGVPNVLMPDKKPGNEMSTSIPSIRPEVYAAL